MNHYVLGAVLRPNAPLKSACQLHFIGEKVATPVPIMPDSANVGVIVVVSA